MLYPYKLFVLLPKTQIAANIIFKLVAFHVRFNPIHGYWWSFLTLTPYYANTSSTPIPKNALQIHLTRIQTTSSTLIPRILGRFIDTNINYNLIKIWGGKYYECHATIALWWYLFYLKEHNDESFNYPRKIGLRNVIFFWRKTLDLFW